MNGGGPTALSWRSAACRCRTAASFAPTPISPIASWPRKCRGGSRSGRGGPRRRRKGQPGQDRVPGQHVARNPHADERHHRHERAAAAIAISPRASANAPTAIRNPRRGAARASSTTSWTSPSSKPARSNWNTTDFHLGETIRAAVGLLRPWPRKRAWTWSAPSIRRPSGCPRRSVPAASGSAQSDRQRGQVHRTRPGRRCAPDPIRPIQVADPHRGRRHRHRHGAGTLDRAVPEIRPGRQLHLPPFRRHRPGAGDQPGTDRADERPAHRRKHRGQGQLFRIVLPLADAVGEIVARGSPRRTAEPVGAALHVLVADDNATNQRLLTALLRGAGHSVTVAANGRKAVEAVAARDSSISC